VDFRVTLRNDIASLGYAILNAVEVESVLEIAQMLGRVTVDPRSPEPMRRISPQHLSIAEPNTLSSRYGDGPFPFHTDVAHWCEPAEYLILYCENPGSGDRPTYLIDSRDWPCPPTLRQAFTTEVWKAGLLYPRLCTLAVESEGRLRIRYDAACVRPVGKRSKRLEEEVQILVAESKRRTIHWKAGMLVVLDNRRILHARGVAKMPDPDRVLIRILVGGMA